MPTPLGVLQITAPDGKEHLVAVYDANPASLPTRLHPEWPKEYYAILVNPVHEGDAITISEAQIFRFDQQQQAGRVGLRLQKNQVNSGYDITVEDPE